jgi:hypothetical protein
MATPSAHPSRRAGSSPGDTDTPRSNPTQLPVEPEFGQALPPAEPEEPGVTKPTI